MSLFAQIKVFVKKFVKNPLKAGIVAYLVFSILKKEFKEGFDMEISEAIKVLKQSGDRKLVQDLETNEYGVIDGVKTYFFNDEGNASRAYNLVISVKEGALSEKLDKYTADSFWDRQTLTTKEIILKNAKLPTTLAPKKWNDLDDHSQNEIIMYWNAFDEQLASGIIETDRFARGVKDADDAVASGKIDGKKYADVINQLKEKYKEVWTQDPLRPETWAWNNSEYVMWVGSNNCIYLATRAYKDIIYHGKSQADAQQKLKKAVKMSPADIRYYGLQESVKKKEASAPGEAGGKTLNVECRKESSKGSIESLSEKYRGKTKVRFQERLNVLHESVEQTPSNGMKFGVSGKIHGKTFNKEFPKFSDAKSYNDEMMRKGADESGIYEIKESLKEGVKEDVAKVKTSLIQRAKTKGGVWENFGQKEIRQLRDKHGDVPEIDELDKWAMVYNGR